MQKWADIHVIVPVARYPQVPGAPKKYELPDLGYQPLDLKTTYFPYPALPLLTRSLNGSICKRLLAPHVRASRPDLILNYWLYPEGYSALRVGRKLGVPVIVGAIGSDVRRIPSASVRRLTSETVAGADAVITVSEELRQATIGLGASADRVTAILNGCDTSVFRPGDRTEARRSLGIESGGELLLYVGNLIPTKGILELADAFAAIAAERPQLRLAAIGEGESAAALQSRARDAGVLDRLLLPGPQPGSRIADWMRACDVFCLPSYSEGCPNVVLEALSCGRPVVATNVGGIPELVHENCGILISAKDPVALGQALAAAVSREWDAGAIAHAFERSWESVALETLAVCERVFHAARSAD